MSQPEQSEDPAEPSSAESAEPSSAESAEQRTERRRFRDDPLSIFLAVAAVLLGLMYFLEQMGLETLEDANLRAQQIGVAELDLEGCTTEAAGKRGSTLVVSCDSTANHALERATETGADLRGFRAVLFVGSDARLRCPIRSDGSPGECAEQAHPDIPENAPGA